jgi:hypothetical protein
MAEAVVLFELDRFRLADPREIVEVITRLIELDIPDALALAKAAVR